MPNPTFPDHSDRCGWNAMLPAREPRAPAMGRIDAKHVVIGAGFTGLAAARRLAERDPDGDIVVLEATTVGEGASGRNSGFLAPADIAGSIEAGAVLKNSERNRHLAEAFDDLLQLIGQHRIACDFHLAGRIKAAATMRGEGSVRDLRKICEALAVPNRVLDVDQLRARIGTSYYRLGLFTEVGHLVQPAALIRGLADALPPAVRLCEHSPVLTLRRQGSKWRVQTADADLVAANVIIAANSSIKAFGYLNDRVVTIYTYAAITQRVKSSDQGCLGEMPSWGLLPAHRLGTTLRKVGLDRLLVRSLYAYERGVSAAYAEAALLDRFHRRYPDLAHIEFEHVWGGTTALTMNGAPYWGRLDVGLFASAGCNGAGIVKGTILGKRLADLVLGRDSGADVIAAFGTANWIAPEPFRRLGFNIASALERRRAGLES
ncbi:MAG TPA: FAD-binding oxidoreductase [Hyphomicrobiaceae bacterium]|nr:FAD-binding oxidoreductase [Hyphomicrobiaceae bacterium]